MNMLKMIWWKKLNNICYNSIKCGDSMKRKIVSNTYLRDVSKYQIKLFMDIDDCYICVKKLIKVSPKALLKLGKFV